MNRKIILTVLSTFPKDYKKQADIITYQCDNGDTIKAEWTNEAGLKYLLGKNIEYTDIVCLRSKETSDVNYENELRAIVEENHITYKDKIKYVDYLVDDDVKTISSKLTKEFKFYPSDTVYIDTTGGARTVAYYLVYLFRYFEYIGVTVKSAVYSQVNRTDDGKITGDGTVKEVKDNFRMFDLINGVHEFTSTGNPKTLKNYFSNCKNEKIHRLLKAMEQFYDKISICIIGDELDKALEDMGKYLETVQNDSNASDDELIFKEMIPVIMEKFLSDKNGKYFGLVKWCLDNGLIQQAITIYDEKFPKTYTESGFFEMNAPDGWKEEFIGHDEFSSLFTSVMIGETKGKKEYFTKSHEKIDVVKHIGDKDFKKICFDYSYIKVVRNFVNHASEIKNQNDPKIKNLIRENPDLYIFPDGNNFSAKDIKEFIRQSVEYIENINCI